MSLDNLISISKIETPDEKRVEWVTMGPTGRATAVRLTIVFFATLVLHLGLIWSLPRHIFSLSPTEKAAHRTQSIQIHMVPPDPRAEAERLRRQMVPPPPPRPQAQNYVEATSAPENKPAETDNISSKNQTASQVMESKDKTGTTPQVENGEDEKANALETGRGRRDQPTMQEIVEDQQQQEGEEGRDAEARKARPGSDQPLSAPAQTPPPPPEFPNALLSDKPASDTGRGVAEYKKSGQGDRIPQREADTEHREHRREIPVVMPTDNPMVNLVQPRVEPGARPGVRPKPRKTINLGAMPTVVRRTTSGLAVPSGSIAFDTKLTEFGDYIARMFEAIGTKWQDLNDHATSSIDDTDTYVTVTFYVNKEGQIEELKVVEATSSQAAQWRCLDAIQSNAPYFDWTKDMVATLGDRQPVMVNFRY